MRIGEIAALVGITTRAIRHYHHVGLLPEPERRPNGYRAYSIRDAVLLARVRRLTELGLSLDEARDALADDAGRELIEVLAELDADLARQEAGIRERRRQLGALLAEPPGATGPVSPGLAALLAQAPGTDSPSAAKDREYVTLMDATGTGNQEIFALLGTLVADPTVVELYERLDALADASVDDPRIAPLAADLVAAVPDELFAAIPENGVVVTGFKEALLAEYSPAQAEVVSRLMDAFMERGRG
ncbi:MerR family transcriptional regulator [Streptomyces sp. RPA4-5]|uniref:MerR family transcriptional regulator n=1 Tax=Streptomyces TaxID=1883 RepID=UPI00143E693D|nr:MULTISPECIES: MerR family transcriptional regulator [Streptomyces]MCX4638891.1 MerR family transcriptional regulator [Streptomyces platensis]QIY59241.1 MerR family transcriptional regulator [Streptomyces sp. RPA4-5]